MANLNFRRLAFPQGFGVALVLLGLLACKTHQKPEDLGPDPGAAGPALRPANTAPAATAATPTSHASACVPVTAQDTSSGNSDALVTLVEFIDLQCPFCARVQATVDTLRRNYDDAELRIVVKHNPLPFHKQAKDAALAAQAVQQTAGSAAALKFMHLALENREQLEDTGFAPWVLQAGADPENFRKAKASSSVSAKVEGDMKRMQALGINATPVFFINGTRLSGAQPLEKFQKAIEHEIAEAQKLKGAGTAQDQLYVERCRENLGSLAN